ncbi:MAG: hypothetical protein AB7N80_05065 [Bdellovibrionales bacterium]
MLRLFLVLNLALAQAAVAEPESGNYRRLRPVQDVGLAHHDHSHPHVLELNLSGAQLDPNGLAAELVDDAHEISHHHGEKRELKAFVRNWLTQLNLVQSGRDLLRWVDYRTHTNPALQEHIGNLGVLFGASHVLETLSGPVGALIGNQVGLPEAVNWAILAVGGVISIPGLDPLCIALAAAYKISPGFRTQITRVRLTLLRGGTALGRFARVPQLMAKFGHWQTGRERILVQLKNSEDGLSLTLPGGFLQFQMNQKHVWLHRVQIQNTDDFKKSWQDWRKHFDGNTRHAVDHALAVPDTKAAPFYVSQAGPAAQVDLFENTEFAPPPSQNWKILDGAIQPWGRWQWCNNLLSRH